MNIGKKLGMMMLAGTAASFSFGKTNTWTATSSAGNWDKPSNWAENRALEAGDFVLVPNGMTATMNDADFETVPAIECIILKHGSSSYAIDVTGTKTNLVTWGVNGTGRNVAGALGTIIKKGTGRARLTRMSNYWYRSNVRVDEGTLQLQVFSSMADSNIMYGKMTVNSPGVLETTQPAEGASSSAVPYTKFWPQSGLVGDGTVLNPSSRKCYLYMGGSGTFSGRLIGSIGIFNDITQTTTVDFKSVEANSLCEHQLGASTRIGLESIGGISPDNTITNYGSIGAGYYYFRQNPGIRYLGNGEVSYARVYADASTSQTFTFDGGANGGLTLANVVSFNAVTAKVTRLNLEGSHTNTCTFSSRTVPPQSTNSLSIAKRGKGTWKLTERADDKQNGLISVENGTLQFTTLAERGVACSLGSASKVFGDIAYGTVSSDKAVPYAWWWEPRRRRERSNTSARRTRPARRVRSPCAERRG